jgi:hypothetical protein
MASLVLEYFKLFLATPPITGFVLIVFMYVFREPLKQLIGRTQGVKFPGGEWSGSQVERTAEAALSGQDRPALPAPELQGEAVAPNQGLVPTTMSPEIANAGEVLTPEAKAKISDFMKAERARAGFWEYRFLNMYLVPHTQAVLDWFASRVNRVTLQLYDAVWARTIPNPEERKAVLGALLNHHLIQVGAGDLIEVTAKGGEYIDFRGPLLSGSAARADEPEPTATS